MVPVRARIRSISSLSAHADADELTIWASEAATPPRRVFVTHGEPEAAESIAALYREKHGWDVRVPDQAEIAPLF